MTPRSFETDHEGQLLSSDKLLSALSQEYLLNFTSNVYIPPWLGKILRFMVFTLQENVLPYVLFINPQAGEITYSTQSIFSLKICPPLQIFSFHKKPTDPMRY